jgi:small redox-active disulfide protein 2
MKIMVLGSGCSKCQKLTENVKKVIEKNHLENVVLEKIEDMKEIVKFGVLSTPALVVDDKVISYGKILTVDEIEKSY